MKTRSRANILLVELLIAILFFMLSATALTEVYAKTHEKNLIGEACADLLEETREIADVLYVSEDPETELYLRGFTGENGFFCAARGPETLRAVISNEQTKAGELRVIMIGVMHNDDILYQLNCTRYFEKEAVQ